jgi:hypothetical protein
MSPRERDEDVTNRSVAVLVVRRAVDLEEPPQP